MAIVRAFEIPGLTLWFWSNDHEPPHFHAKRRGEWEVKVHFLLDAAEMVFRKEAQMAEGIRKGSSSLEMLEKLGYERMLHANKGK